MDDGPFAKISPPERIRPTPTASHPRTALRCPRSRIARPVTEGEGRVDAAAIGALYVQYAERLRVFLVGLLRNRELANEALQATFGKAVTAIHNVREESLKAWLFQVAYNEAMAIRRRQGVEAKSLQKLSWISRTHSEAPEEELVRWESVRRVREALEQLPHDQRTVVQMRIYEERKFAEIASLLGVPLGTVLTRMRLALQKLQKSLNEE